MFAMDIRCLAVVGLCIICLSLGNHAVFGKTLAREMRYFATRGNYAVFGKTLAHEMRNSATKDSPCEQITFISRTRWGAKPPKAVVRMPGPVGYTIIHHTDSSQCNSLTDCSNKMRIFQDWHFNNGWNDIGYNFVIGGDGRVYIGRGWDTVGTHAGSAYYNRHSEGIAIIGDYTSSLPSREVLAVFHQLTECGVELGYLTDRYVLKGHRDVRVRRLGPTSCPGDALYAEIQTWPHYM